LVEVRIGDLLREKGLVRASDLAAAVEAQAREGRRLCSMLITRGALDFDEGARVLGEQRGVPCALSKHLANRDIALAALLPADFGRASNALPIGRTSGGALIVAARDPAPALRASLEKLLGADVTLVIAPATRLEHLIAAAYGVPVSDEFDVDVDSQVDLPPHLPPLPDVDMLDPDSMRMALSDLDDARVAKDPTQSGLLQIGAMASSSSLKIQARALPPAAPTIEATKLALEHVGTRDVASDLAMSFIAGRWLSGAIVAIREDTAIGYRGHGIVDLAELHLPLRLASTVQRAIQTKRVAQGSSPSPAQDQLVKVLRANSIVAAPVLVGDELVAVITAGDSIHGAADSNAPIELGQLAQALGDAYDRIRRT
jgi:Type II secretion system (T2SS), protein E, N-terminal domain